MKTLLLIRHAKSSSGFGIADFDRPLNEKGKEDAAMMAARIKNQLNKVDLYVSSPARRAQKTARIFMKECDESAQLILEPTLYEAMEHHYYEVIEKLDDKYKTVALFAHNPGITEFINSLDNTAIFNMPTCGIYVVQIDTNHWVDFQISKKECILFDYPKEENDG